MGSEIHGQHAIDETLQIYGGNGFSAEYPIELAYRNSPHQPHLRRHQRDQPPPHLRAAPQKGTSKGKLDLMSAVQGGDGQGEPVTEVDAPEALQDAYLAVENLKRAVLVVAGLGR